jgi:RNA polymerase sigma-70 factor (ECF subfamily)
VDSSRDPHAEYVSDLQRDQGRRAVERLPLEFREIILLREYEEFSYEEIATMLQCPVGTVMSRLARARTKLRDLLAAAAMATWKAADNAKGARVRES